MNYFELTKLLRKAGWRFERNGKGSHRIWRHPDKKFSLPIPDHGSKELNPGLVNGIKQKAGLK